MKTTTLSLTGTTGTIVDNRDGTHESSVINVTDNQGMTGQLSLLMPKRVLEGKDQEQGLQPGEYSISISLTRKAEEVKAARATDASADASVGTTTDRRNRGTTGA